MRNILLFGPPASGKLSIATAIAENGKHVVIDNHRTIDAANIINADQRIQVKKLSERMREWLYAADDINVIATVVYAAGTDDALIEKYSSWLSRPNESCLLVQLHCPQEIVKERCTRGTRFGTSKIVDPGIIEKLYSENDFDSKHPNQSVMHLHTDNSSAVAIANQIYRHAEQGAQPDAFGAC